MDVFLFFVESDFECTLGCLFYRQCTTFDEEYIKKGTSKSFRIPNFLRLNFFILFLKGSRPHLLLLVSCEMEEITLKTDL